MMPDPTGPVDPLAAAQAAAFQQADWQQHFKRNAKLAIMPSLFNTLLVFDKDPKWRGVIAFDEFAYRVVKCKTPPTRVVRIGEWSDLDDVQALVYIT